jgi:hypothetical protein
MCYSNIIENPLIVAVFASLIGVAVAYIANLLYDWCKYNKKRKSALKILLSQLQSHKKQLGVLADNLGKNRIYAALDATPIFNFLNSDVVDLNKDEKLIENLVCV